MKKISILFVLIGCGFLLYGGYQHVKTKIAQQNSLKEANELLTVQNQDIEINAITFDPEIGETVGILEIPSIDGELPIVEGTDPDELDKGVGHYRGTAYPMQNDQIVMSGHRDTVFRRLGEVELGDIITVKLPYGERTYEMVDSKIVDADDRTIIKPMDDEELVITTCYPFSYIGDAPDRYILYAKPIDDG